MTRRQLKWPRWTTFCVELLGLGLSLFLVLISFKIIYPTEVPCPRGKLFHCTSVLRGEWSKWGPIPISVLGVVYFLFQSFLTALAERHRPWIHRVKIGGAAGALLYLAWLRAVEIVWLKGLCPWCWAVALVTLLEVYLLYPLAMPPLPRLSVGKRVGAIAAVFLASVVVATGFGFWLFEREQTHAKRELARELGQKTAVPSTTPVAKKAANPPDAPPRVAEVKPSPTRAVERNSPPQNVGEVEEGVLLTNEIKILVRHGWAVVSSTKSVNRAIEKESPVLLLVFDPFCEECHAFIRGGLESQEIRKLPVKLVAIEQSALEGKLSNEVSHVPCLMLIDRAGNVLFKHEGRMTTPEVVKAVETHLRP